MLWIQAEAVPFGEVEIGRMSQHTSTWWERILVVDVASRDVDERQMPLVETLLADGMQLGTLPQDDFHDRQ